MAIAFLIDLINILTNLIFWLVIFYVVLGYFIAPYHPVMEFLRRLVSPMLDPIRRILPPIGMLDFSPIILIILVQLIGWILIRLILIIF
ncbi:MAG: YggT family protein [Anaerolineales bacterium]|jgi:YggT family protein